MIEKKVRATRSLTRNGGKGELLGTRGAVKSPYFAAAKDKTVSRAALAEKASEEREASAVRKASSEVKKRSSEVKKPPRAKITPFQAVSFYTSLISPSPLMAFSFLSLSSAPPYAPTLVFLSSFVFSSPISSSP